MPIYAYRCGDCGFEKDVLQKFSDAPLSDCPQCHKPAFARTVTAPTFQLKGTGWYVTDFRGGNTPQAGKGDGGGGNGKADGAGNGGDAGASAGGAAAASPSGTSAGADASKAS